MWKTVIIFASFLFTSDAQIPSDGECYLEGVDETHWVAFYRNVPVDDFEDKEFAKFKAENIEGLEVTGEDYGKYFKAEIDEEGYLVLSPTEDFKKYEIEQESTANPEMNIWLAFKCSNEKTKTLVFYQPVRDSNTYDPKFRQPSYTYELTMPLPANYDLALFGVNIEACDDDISNTRVTFSITPNDDFDISWKGIVDGTKNKCHVALIKTKKVLRLASSKEYVITVQDAGEPPGRATTKFTIEVNEETSTPPNPQFGAAYYTATYELSEDAKDIITTDDITLKEGCSKLKFNLIGEHQKYFNIKCEAETVIIGLEENLPEAVLENSPIVLVTIEAILEKAEDIGRTVLVVYLPKKGCPEITTVPSVTCPPTITPTECPICPTESVTPMPTCPPCNTECPSTSECPPCITTPSECSTSPSECPPCLTTTSELTTECPVCPTTPSTVTECPLSCPPCSTTPGECPAPEITTDCPVCTTTPSTATECPLSCPPCSTTPGECPAPEPTTECPVCTTTPSTATECPLTCPPSWTTPATECPLCPTEPGECSSTPSECPISCPSTPQTTECPPCLTTTEPSPPETIIKFERDNYSYKIEYWRIGYAVGVVRATVSPKEEIEYSIDPDTNFLECNKNTGELSISKSVNVGIYYFTAYAVGVETQHKAQASVVIEIKEKDENETPDSEYSLLVKHVTEEKATEIVLPCHYSYCKYTKVKHIPETEDDIFEVEDNVLHVSKIKREREDIIDMKVPQFFLHFFLDDVGTPIKNSRGNNSYNELQETIVPSEWAFIPSDVPNLPNQLLLSIIIDDINNNKPVFEAGSKLIVGYPTAEITLQVVPPYLVKVLATDIDAEENAVIRYSTDSLHFVIHPETGVIYPAEDAFNNEDNLKFTVIAKDRNGAEDGLEAELKVEVKLLKEENLAVLLVKNLMLEDLEETMQKLSEESDMKISYLTAATIPFDSTTKFQATESRLIQLRGFLKSMIIPTANADHYSRVIIYGLDDDDKPVKLEELQEALEDVEILEDFTIDKWVPETLGGGEIDDPSTTGYVAAIAVLASLLVIFIIAAAVFYYFKIYKVKKSEPYDTMDEEDTNSVNFEKNPRLSSVSKYEETSPQRRPTGFVFNPPPIQEDEDEIDDRLYEDTSNYGIQEKWSNADTVDHGENKVRFVDNPKGDLYGGNKVQHEDDDFDGDRRKSVTFKETVEKINIVVDDRPDDDNIDERL